MATATQPTIVWKQYKLTSGGDGLTQGTTLNGNTVDYQAVEAGQYSPAICVRPQFSNNVSDSGAIGSVRLWWSTTTANNPSNQTVTLPAQKWVLKYYVSDCTQSLFGDKSSQNSVQRCAKMLSYLSSSDRVSKVATDKTFNSAEISNNNANWTWCRSVWQSNDDNTAISMQPVPFTGYKDTVKEHEVQYSAKYNGNTWVTTVFGRASDQTYEDGSLMDYAAGGILTSQYKCNVKGYVNGNNTEITNGSVTTSGFPYLFFTIKAPTDAAAGTWTGWACRISYIWPYTVSTTTTA